MHPLCPAPQATVNSHKIPGDPSGLQGDLGLKNSR